MTRRERERLSAVIGAIRLSALSWREMTDRLMSRAVLADWAEACADELERIVKGDKP